VGDGSIGIRLVLIGVSGGVTLMEGL
jgi:hypothetical protein